MRIAISPVLREKLQSVLAALILGLPHAATAQDDSAPIVVLGKVRTHDWAKIEIKCPEDAVCLNGWTRWEIDVVKTIKGSNVSKRIVALHLQHGLYKYMDKDSIKLFVLEPLDPSLRSQSKADYEITDFSGIQPMYCLQQSPQEVGLELEAVLTFQNADEGMHCFDIPEEWNVKARRR